MYAETIIYVQEAILLLFSGVLPCPAPFPPSIKAAMKEDKNNNEGKDAGGRKLKPRVQLCNGLTQSQEYFMAMINNQSLLFAHTNSLLMIISRAYAGAVQMSSNAVTPVTLASVEQKFETVLDSFVDLTSVSINILAQEAVRECMSGLVYLFSKEWLKDVEGVTGHLSSTFFSLSWFSLHSLCLLFLSFICFVVVVSLACFPSPHHPS